MSKVLNYLRFLVPWILGTCSTSWSVADVSMTGYCRSISQMLRLNQHFFFSTQNPQPPDLRAHRHGISTCLPWLNWTDHRMIEQLFNWQLMQFRRWCLTPPPASKIRNPGVHPHRLLFSIWNTAFSPQRPCLNCLPICLPICLP